MSAVERRLVRALLDRAGNGAVLLRTDATPWASLTFEGHRRLIELMLPAAAVTAFATALDAFDLPLPGHFLASIAVEEQVEDAPGTARLVIGALTLIAG